MKAYIAVDANKIVRCLASERCNIHKDKLGMEIYYVERGGIVGDEYDITTNTWTARPENYPKPPDPSQDELNELKIRAEMDALLREQAIRNLKDRNELPADF